MGLKQKHLDNFLSFAIKTIRKSEKITLKYYGKTVKHKLKKNKTPVTLADIKCEKFIISRITEKFPGHGLLTEETGIIEKQSEFKWIIDPIDGTRNFIRKHPYWGTLLALEYMGEVVLGIISMPAAGELIYAVKGGGCFLNNKKTRVSKIKNIKDSYCIYGSLELIINQPYKNNFLNLIKQCTYSRGFGDCHGHTFIIDGKAEIMVDPNVAPYDIAASKLCIAEAGGILTDLNGNDTIYSGSALISNGKVHDEALKIINEGFISREITK
jgi:histidinol phosphatase-like enzyme (inositol monophosphatase family)